MRQLVLYLKILIKKKIEILKKHKALWIQTERLERKNTDKGECFSLKEGSSSVTKRIFLNNFLKDLWQKSVLVTDLEAVMKWKEFWTLAAEQEHKNLETISSTKLE